MKTPPFEGLLAPPHTPLTSSGELNLSAVEQQAQRFCEYGLTGVFVAGSTGEGPSLTLEERRLLAERWVEVARGTDLAVVIQVGAASIVESRTLAQHAQEIGASAIACLPPFYLVPADVEALVESCRQVADAAPALPFYYYHIPILTGVDFSMPRFFGMASERIPSLVGMKFTHQDLAQASQVMGMQNGKFNVLLGWDQGWLSALCIGIPGAVGCCYNFAAPLFLQVREAFEKGDLESARRHQRTAIEMVDVITKYGHIVPASKVVMKLTGLDCGPPRLPLQAMSQEQERALARDLEAFPIG